MNLQFTLLLVSQHHSQDLRTCKRARELENSRILLAALVRRLYVADRRPGACGRLKPG